ncbi:MAG: transcriptional regulator [Chlorobium sp.]|nr:MAG: transcriptional regulator [Chlorobium sp.]
MEQTEEDKILTLFHSHKVIRSSDLEKYGCSRQALKRLVAKGHVTQIGRGLYRQDDDEVTEHATVVEVSKAFPQGVLCLVSALHFYQLSTQIPHEVWMAVKAGKRVYRTDLPVQFFRFSGRAYTEGVETHKIEGVAVHVYCPAKTVADCFKFRNTIGLDVALEALQECLKVKRCSIDDLWHYAGICRVRNVMRPYMEAYTQ